MPPRRRQAFVAADERNRAEAEARVAEANIWSETTHPSSPPREVPPPPSAPSTPSPRPKGSRGRPGAAVVRTPDPNRGVLPDDVPDEQMQLILDANARLAQEATKQAGVKRGNNTENQYKKTWDKWWNLFCTYAKWDPEEKTKFVADDGTINDGTFRQFFTWMGNDVQNIGPSPYKTCLSQAQRLLERQLTVRKLMVPRPFYVRSIPSIRAITSRIKTVNRNKGGVRATGQGDGSVQFYDLHINVCTQLN